MLTAGPLDNVKITVTCPIDFLFYVSGGEVTKQCMLQAVV